MANQEQVERLKAGVKEWNKWRGENPGIEIDLEGAHLDEAHLKEARLEGANLKGAYLKEAILEGANLKKANLEGAVFRRANLCGADLRLTNLRTANLYRADLRSTNIRGANLRDAVLKEANLSGSLLGETHLEGLDLSTTKGLEEARHSYPSPVSTSTLQRSKGEIPEVFLRGCGLSDWEIESAKLYQPGLDPNQITDITYRVAQILIGNPIQYSSCFISYCQKDQDFAQKLYNNLQDSGVRCWFAPEDIQGGQKIYEQIDAAIRTRERLLLVLSESSMNSEWVKTEIAKARKREDEEKRRVLFPIRLVNYESIKEWECFDADRCKDSAREIREYFIPDFSNWQDENSYKSAFERLLKDLRI
jgi:uncharacterized protein YjbI with pentapeptide repeats